MKTLKTYSAIAIQRRRRIVAAITAAVLLFCAFGGPGGDSFGVSSAGAVGAAGGNSTVDKPTFKDVKNGDWFAPFITELADEGVVSGYPDGTFRPANQVTTGQFLSMIVQAGQRSGVVAEEMSQALTESGQAVRTHWAQEFYDTARENDLIFDDELPKTSLDQPIPRLWMAVISSRMMGTGMAADGGALSSKEFDEALEKITDVEELQPYSYEIVTAYGRGLLSGYPDGTFRPEGYLTRAEAVTVIHKLSAILEEGTAPKASEPEPSTYGFKQDPADMTAGTKLFWCMIPVGEDAGSHTELKALMTKEVPELSEELYRSFEGFVQRAIPEQAQGKQGMRKEYVGGYPVLMEAIGGEVHIYVKPQGSETRFWNVEPGQISEEFF